METLTTALLGAVSLSSLPATQSFQIAILTTLLAFRRPHRRPHRRPPCVVGFVIGCGSTFQASAGLRTPTFALAAAVGLALAHRRRFLAPLVAIEHRPLACQIVLHRIRHPRLAHRMPATAYASSGVRLRAARIGFGLWIAERTVIASSLYSIAQMRVTSLKLGVFQRRRPRQAARRQRPRRRAAWRPALTLALKTDSSISGT